MNTKQRFLLPVVVLIAAVACGCVVLGTTQDSVTLSDRVGSSGTPACKMVYQTIYEENAETSSRLKSLESRIKALEDAMPTPAALSPIALPTVPPPPSGQRETPPEN